MRSNLILFVLVLVLVNQNFIGTRDEDEGSSSDLCPLTPETHARRRFHDAR
jgi:hypothetical protein